MPIPANVNLATKFSPKLDESFKLRSYTDNFTNKDYDFDGVNAVKVWSLDTVPLVDYDMSSNTNRYGGFSEITDTVQTFTMTQDKAFERSLDTLNEQDSLLAKKAAHWLALEWNRVVIPHVDKYRFTKAYAAATGAGGGGTITYDPAAVLEQIYEMNSNVDEVSCPDDGRALFVAPSVFKDIKKEVVPLLNNPGDQMVRSRGLAGTIDGVAVVKVPSNLLPTGVKALFWHKSALLAAQKLHEAKILEGGHVMSGHIIKGRLRHDAWALKGYDSASGINTKLATFQALVAAPPTP